MKNFRELHEVKHTADRTAKDRVKRYHSRLKSEGYVSYQRRVTPYEKEALDAFLRKLRNKEATQ